MLKYIFCIYVCGKIGLNCVDESLYSHIFMNYAYIIVLKLGLTNTFIDTLQDNIFTLILFFKSVFI